MSGYEFFTLMASTVAAVAAILAWLVARRAYTMSLYSQKLQNAQALVNNFYYSLRENPPEEIIKGVIWIGTVDSAISVYILLKVLPIMVL